MNGRIERSRRWPLLLILIAGLVACGDDGGNADPAFVEDTLTPDTVTPERAATRGLPANADTSKPPGTLGDPAAGTRIVATLTEWAITLSEDAIPVGQVTIVVRNEGTVAHALELTGQYAGRWRSLPLNPGAEVQMSMVLSDGTYQVYCPLDDEAGDHSERGQETTLVVR
jgi:hypothetical protein